MSTRKTRQAGSKEMLETADRFRDILSRWVRTTRDQAGTPTSAKVETLAILHREGPASIARLAQRRSVKHQSMRLVIEQLETDGAVEKQVDPRDRRNQSVSLTEAGRSILQQAQRARTAWIAQLLEQDCTPEERDQVVTAIAVLEKLLSKVPAANEV